MTCELELPSKLATIHPLFHILMLNKCLRDPSLILPIESVGVRNSLSYKEIQIQIFDGKVHKLRTKEVASLKSYREINLLKKIHYKSKKIWKPNTCIYLYLLMIMSKVLFPSLILSLTFILDV